MVVRRIPSIRPFAPTPPPPTYIDVIHSPHVFVRRRRQNGYRRQGAPSIVICGHVDSGKSTTTGRLIFELGGIPEREIEKLRAEADAPGKSSFAFAFYMDRQKEERELV